MSAYEVAVYLVAGLLGTGLLALFAGRGWKVKLPVGTKAVVPEAEAKKVEAAEERGRAEGLVEAAAEDRREATAEVDRVEMSGNVADEFNRRRGR